jgi:hypothetical protein
VLVLASCKSLPPPPEHLASYWHARTGDHGYVASIGYFSRAQMKDADWEFRRIQAAAGSLCNSYRHAVRRDVQWFETRPGSGEYCARVVYTFRCFSKSDIGNPVPTDALEATRSAVMAEPVPRPLERGCGEKDSDKRHPPRKPPLKPSSSPTHQEPGQQQR